MSRAHKEHTDSKRLSPVHPERGTLGILSGLYPIFLRYPFICMSQSKSGKRAYVPACKYRKYMFASVDSNDTQ